MAPDAPSSLISARRPSAVTLRPLPPPPTRTTRSAAARPRKKTVNASARGGAPIIFLHRETQARDETSVRPRRRRGVAAGLLWTPPVLRLSFTPPLSEKKKARGTFSANAPKRHSHGRSQVPRPVRPPQGQSVRLHGRVGTREQQRRETQRGELFWAWLCTPTPRRSPCQPPRPPNPTTG